MLVQHKKMHNVCLKAARWPVSSVAWNRDRE